MMEAWRGTGDRLGWRPPLSTKLSAGWPCGIGAGQSEGSESRNVATVGAPTHERSRCAEHGRMGCARPTGGSHGRTTRGPAQRGEGAKAKGRAQEAEKRSETRAGVEPLEFPGP